MSRNINSKLWRLAGYNPIFMDYCSTLKNKVAGIGAFFIFQILILYASIITLFKVFFPEFLPMSFLIGGFSIIIFYKLIDLINRINHKITGITILVLQLFLSTIFSLLVSIPFCLFLFENQIGHQLFLIYGKSSFSKIEQLWLMPIGLYESCFLESEGVAILSICIAVFIIVVFVYSLPYILIYNERNSHYTLLKINYERYFKKQE